MLFRPFCLFSTTYDLFIYIYVWFSLNVSSEVFEERLKNHHEILMCNLA